jgi:hypothetical protein
MSKWILSDQDWSTAELRRPYFDVKLCLRNFAETRNWLGHTSTHYKAILFVNSITLLKVQVEMDGQLTDVDRELRRKVSLL